MLWKVVAATVAGALLFVPTLQSDVQDAASLKAMVEGLGYEVKSLNSEPGKEKIEFTIKTDTLNVPIGAEVSPSKNYIWLTVSLGPAPKPDSAKNAEMLKENGRVQPSFFYITSKDNLMVAYPIDNRGLTAKDLRRCIDKVSGDVEKTKPTWQAN